MKRASLFAAAAVVLVANAFALVHARANRSGAAESDITLSQRELSTYTTNDDDSGVALNLQWIGPWPRLTPGDDAPWLDRKSLHELGFNTSIAASDVAAFEFYSHQRARRAFVALEYDGPSWRKWIDDLEHQPRYPRPANQFETNQRESSTRLVAMDAGSDAGRLRARHPDRGSVIIVPAVIRIVVETQPNGPARLYGAIDEIPNSIHVPLPFSEALRRTPVGPSNVRYRVHLRYGASFEPWVMGVEFPRN